VNFYAAPGPVSRTTPGLRFARPAGEPRALLAELTGTAKALARTFFGRRHRRAVDGRWRWVTDWWALWIGLELAVIGWCAADEIPIPWLSPMGEPPAEWLEAIVGLGAVILLVWVLCLAMWTVGRAIWALVLVPAVRDRRIPPVRVVRPRRAKPIRFSWRTLLLFSLWAGCIVAAAATLSYGRGDFDAELACILAFWFALEWSYLADQGTITGMGRKARQRKAAGPRST